MIKNRVTAMVQARMSSTRLPDKILKTLSDKPVIWHVVNRLKKSKNIDDIVVITPNSEKDRKLHKYLSSENIPCFIFKGDENNLNERYLSCAEKYETDIIVIINSDCPLIHPETIDRMVIKLKENEDSDYVALIGDTIEGGAAVIRTRAMKQIKNSTKKKIYYEHSTLYLLEHPEEFNIVNIPADPNFLKLKHRLWLDTEDDLKFLRKIYEKLYKEGEIVDLHDVINLLLENRELMKINGEIRTKDLFIEKTINKYVNKISGSNLELVNCNLCNSNDFEIVWQENDREEKCVICKNCGLVYTNPRKSTREIIKLYETFSQSYPDSYLLSDDNNYKRAAEERFSFLKKYIEKDKNSLLEIGSSYGFFMKEAIENNIKTTGIEPSEEQVNFARKYLKIENIKSDRFENIKFDEKFDMAASFHVLEHLQNPDQFIKFIYENLKEEGILFMDIPNGSNLIPTIMEYIYFVSNQHLYQFTPDTITSFLEKNGFEILFMENLPIPPVYISNLRIVAKKKKIDSDYEIKNSFNNSLKYMKKYFSDIEKFKIKIETLTSEWIKNKKKVIIYGGGLHTKGLLELVDFREVEVAGIVDDDKEKWGMEYFGWKIIPFEKLKELDFDIILISSLGAEEKIYNKVINNLNIEEIGVYKIYG